MSAPLKVVVKQPTIKVLVTQGVVNGGGGGTVDFDSVNTALSRADSPVQLNGQDFNAGEVSAQHFSVFGGDQDPSAIVLTGWGTGAACSAVSLADNGQMTVTSGSAPSANPTIDLPYTREFIGSPYAIARVVSPADSVLAQITCACTIDDCVMTFQGTPEAGVTYVIQYLSVGAQVAF